MRRKLVLVIHCLVMAVTGFAQINFNYLHTDSLRQELLKAKNDTGRVLLMANLAEGYRWSNPDSAIYFGQNALELANQVDFPRGQAAALISISVVQRELGNLAKALDLATQALTIAQHHQFAIEEVSSLIRVANVYSAANNYGKALVYLHQAEYMSRNNGNKLYENISQWLIASAFERTNRLDSASYYADVAFKNTSWDASTDFSYNILGDIQLKLKKDSLALSSYRIGLKEAERASDYRTDANLSISLANYYKKHNQLDSAVYYAKRGLAVAQLLSYKNRIISSSSILADIYETRDPQEALKYYRIYNAAKDSLYGSEKMQTLQTLMMDEQEKQKATQAKQLAYQNLVKQIGLLTGLLFVLVILSLLYRNNRRKQKANELLQKQKQEIEERKAQAEIETALEKVRTIAMSMRRRDDMLEICKVIADQLMLLNIKEIRNVQTAIFYEEKGTYMNYEFYARHDKLLITEVDYKHHPTQYEFAYKMLQGSEELFTLSLEGGELKDWYEYQKTTPQFADRFLETAPSLNYYWYSMGPVALGASTYHPLSKEQIILFKQFRNVFELSYRRYLDIEKAEAQAREAKIEAGLERTRTQSMIMQHSRELDDTLRVFHEQVLLLDIPSAFSFLWLPDEKNDRHIFWAAWKENKNGSAVFKSKAINYPLDRNEPATAQCLVDWKSNEPVYSYHVPSAAVKNYFAVWQELIDGVEHLNPEYFSNGLHYVEAFMKYGCFGVMVVSDLTEDEKIILCRFAIEFERTYTRFLDLQKAEAQAMEARIEAALEKVRSRSLAVHQSDEFKEVINIVFEKLQELEIPVGSVSINIFIEGSKDIDVYACGHTENGLDVRKARLNYFDHPISNDLYNAHKSGLDFFVGNYDKKTKNIYYEYQFKHSLKDLPAEIKEKILQTEHYSLTMVPAKNSIIIINNFEGKALSEIEINIQKRFAAVFDQAYTRFLDLQKAELLAREARIETALEKVRARTMAMQHSNELKDAAALLFQQVKSLGAPAYSCGYNIWEKNEKEFTSWMSTQDGSIINGVPNIPLTEDANFIRYVESKQNGEPFFVLELAGERMQEHYQYLKTIPAFKAYFDYAVGVGFDLPKTQIHHLANFSHGNLLFITLEPCPEFHSVFKRFAAVFEQTYTRFLDLQRAEAQARESQIEAALERVRSRSMGMQKSEELKEVIQVVYEQFVHLNILVEHTGFIIDYKTRDDMNIWLADKHAVPFQVTIPYFDCAHWNSFNEAKEKGMDFFANHLSYEEKNKFYGDLFVLIPGLPEETLKYYFSCPGLAISTVLLENIGLYIENFSGTPYSDEENNTLMRFGKVFQQTYTRFLDLQKVEAQAREATIESALEKVRGKAMAMHNSNDLSVTASMVFTELRKLGINPIRCGVGLLNKESHKGQLYSAASSPDGDGLSLVGWALLENHPVLERIYHSWEKGEDYFPELTGEQLKHYYELLLAGLPVNVPDWQNGQKQYGHFFSFSIGCLYAWSENPYNDAEIKILKRFASIIDLTFRRYMDLQKSEASTKEAVKQAALDRIRADIASMRTVDDLDRIIPLVWNELTTLGVPFIRCGVFIMKNDEQQIHTFLSTPDGKAIASFHLPYDSPGNISKVLSHWQNNEIYKDHWDDDAFREFANGLVKQGALKSSKQYLSTLPVGGFYLHFVPFLQGMLYVGNTTELSNDEIKLLQAVAEAFSTAYARYEDFNKLEGAKKQVERTLVELKQAQTQLVQSEKMASLGELTAGIAHEIQNPLNFVNNFSEVSSELMDEIKAELDKGDTAEAKAIADDVKQNLEKIAHHGKRADAIVKSMLQHSRKSSGQKDLVDINALVDEYLRLSYHGFRAKEKSFNAIIESHFDSQIGKIKAAGQDIGRVLLNLFNNAFYAVNEKIKQQQNGFEPTLQVTTTKLKESLEIKIKDNGIGIPERVLEKIYQPFFTTKPTGEGTGLGLSLSYDIITKGHGGNLKVETEEGEGSEFIILLPTT